MSQFTLRARLAEPDLIMPDDLRRAFGTTEALPALRWLVGRFGRLLRCWPVMVEAARDLRASGVRPGEPPDTLRRTFADETGCSSDSIRTVQSLH